MCSVFDRYIAEARYEEFFDRAFEFLPPIGVLVATDGRLLSLPRRRRQRGKVGAPVQLPFSFFLMGFFFVAILCVLWCAPLSETVVVLLMLLLGVCGAI